MKKHIFLKKKAILSVSAIMAASMIATMVPVYAATTDNTQTETQAVETVDNSDSEYGNLTEDQIEQLNKIYDRIDEIDTLIWGENCENYNEDMTEDDIDALYAPYEDELNSLYEQAEELEEASGLYEDYELNDGDYDYGNLTEDQINELIKIYDRIDEIDTLIWGEDYENYDEDMTDEDIDALYAPYEDELNSLYEQAEALEEASGLYDYDEDYEDDYDYEEYYGNLTEDQIEELNKIYDRIDEIDTLIWGEDYENYDEDMTDEDIDALYAPYEDELNSLYDQAYELEVAAGFYDGEVD